MPAGVRYIKQMELGDEYSYDFKASACGACVLVSAAYAFNTNTSLADAIAQGNVNGTTAYVNSWVYGGMDASSIYTYNFETALGYIRSQTDAGFPVIIRLDGHFVVATGYNNYGDSAVQITVMDPMLGHTNLQKSIERKSQSFQYVKTCKRA